MTEWLHTLLHHVLSVESVVKNSWVAEQNVIIRTAVSDSKVAAGKIYIREQFGQFQRLRRRLNSLLLAAFVLLPLLRYQGQQAILIDVARQRMDIFGLSLFPQDLLILALLFMLAAFVLFFVSKRYGRVWCGYTCPQTIWTLMFNWIERRVEGTHHQSQVLDRQTWSHQKVTRKLLKHLLWAMLSLLTALAFMAYFVPSDALYQGVVGFELSPLITGWVAFFTLCTYLNAGFLREKMCTHACPYSRFQAALFDASTKLVAYDAIRGESRGPRKRNTPKATGLGDCVDCKLCVQVCPVGIDIRDGLQYDCINCGLCVDACDATMARFNYPKGLIRYARQATPVKANRLNLGYALTILLTLSAMVYWGISRNTFEVNLLRDRQALYRINTAGKVENTYLLKTLNKSQQVRNYKVSVDNNPNFSIRSSQVFSVKPGEYQLTALPVSYQGTPQSTKQTIAFTVVDLQSGETLNRTSSFYSGTGAW